MTPEERREQQRSNRAYRKGRKRCTKCGARDARTEAGRVLCAKCAAKESVYHKKHLQNRTPEQRARVNQRTAERRAAKKAAGLCTTCGKPRDREGAICSKCLERYRARRKEAAR